MNNSHFRKKQDKLQEEMRNFDRFPNNFQLFSMKENNECDNISLDLSFLEDPLFLQNTMENNIQIQTIIEQLFYTIYISFDKESEINKSLLGLQKIAEKLKNNSHYFTFEYICLILIDLLDHESSDVLLNCLKLIQILSQSCRELLSLLIKHNLLQILFEVFEYTELNPNVFHSILTIASNIASYSPNKIATLFEFGYQNLIHQAIGTGNLNCKIRAAEFLSNIMYKGTRIQIESIINQSNIEFLFEFLDEEYENCLRHCILHGISKSIEVGIFIDEIEFKGILKTDKYTEVLHSLANNEDEVSADLAQCILSSIMTVQSE